MINVKEFDSGVLKIEKESYKNIGSYNIGYITTKKIDDYESIYSVNPVHLMIDIVIEHIEENNGNKCLVFDFKTEIINDGECKYGNYFEKIKFDTDDDVPLNKPLNLHMLIIIVRSVFEEE